MTSNSHCFQWMAAPLQIPVSPQVHCFLRWNRSFRVLNHQNGLQLLGLEIGGTDVSQCVAAARELHFPPRAATHFCPPHSPLWVYNFLTAEDDGKQNDGSQMAETSPNCLHLKGGSFIGRLFFCNCPKGCPNLGVEGVGKQPGVHTRLDTFWESRPQIFGRAFCLIGFLLILDSFYAQK